MRLLKLIFILSFGAFLAGCTGTPEKPPYPGIKLGNPYEVSGTWYKPHYDPDYDEIGMASWYGPGFHGGHTANGEKYDQEGLTGAHRTLPLPSLVRVTNLDNGKSAIVKINDRGPFARNRIIDVSRATAVKIGMIRIGTAKVRVQFLERETREYVENLQRGNKAYAMEDYNRGEVQPMPAVSMASAPIETMAPIASDNNRPEIKESSIPVISSSPAAAIVPAPGSPDIFSVVDDAQASEAPASPVHTSSAITQAAYGGAPSGNYRIQAGTFGMEENAKKMQLKLRSLGDSQVTTLIIKNHTFYRVTLGPYMQQDDAKNILSKLALMGIADARITHN